jgi:predicted MFS family arabinose efflux permease
MRASLAESIDRVRGGAALPALLRRASFRRLWAGMNVSIAGNTLQRLAQSWLVVSLTGSALAVGGLATVGSLPQLLLPLGGVVADQVDRKRVLVSAQLLGVASTVALAGLVLAGRVAVWHIYAWTFIRGVIWLLARPAYKVMLTESVPPDEVRSATAMNSMTESVSRVVVDGGGGLLLAVVGLPVAFILNAATYLLCVGSVWGLEGIGQLPETACGSVTARRVATDLVGGIVYLARQPRLLYPLLLTTATFIACSPGFGLLAAVVHDEGGSIANLGLLASAGSIGTFIGAGYAGARGEGENATRRYALLGLFAAGALALFTKLPVGLVTMLPLVMIGFVAFSEAVWNTSRIRSSADPAYQGRLQALTTMTFNQGSILGGLWGGAAVDRFGRVALLGGAVAPGAMCLGVMAVSRRRATAETFLEAP